MRRRWSEGSKSGNDCLRALVLLLLFARRQPSMTRHSSRSRFCTSRSACADILPPPPPPQRGFGTGQRCAGCCCCAGEGAVEALLLLVVAVGVDGAVLVVLERSWRQAAQKAVARSASNARRRALSVRHACACNTTSLLVIVEPADQLAVDLIELRITTKAQYQEHSFSPCVQRSKKCRNYVPGGFSGSNRLHVSKTRSVEYWQLQQATDGLKVTK